MGVLCDIYIADRERAKKYSFRGECACECKSRRVCKCWDEFAPETYDCIESHRIYAHNFAQLLSVLRGKRYRDEMNSEFKMIKQFSDEGPWIQKVPDDLPKLLATKTTAELKSINKAWIELMSEMWPIPTKNQVILDYLKLLQNLCKLSLEKKKSMYLWTCL